MGTIQEATVLRIFSFCGLEVFSLMCNLFSNFNLAINAWLSNYLQFSIIVPTVFMLHFSR